MLVCTIILPLLALGGLSALASGGKAPNAPNIIYVDADATGGATGLSWAHAYTDLQDALAVATYGDEIWVAEGAYTPGITRTDTFSLANGVALYGGFVGTETLRTQRNWEAHVTVLSGDIDDNDIKDGHGVITDAANTVGENVYHVVSGSGVTESTTLDGFVVTGGWAYYSGMEFIYDGGGMYNVNSSPMLANLTFSGNSASRDGGGVYNSQSSPVLANVAFNGNFADSGGGMYSRDSKPALTDVTFSSNSCVFYGGGMYNSNSDSTLTNVTFSGNSSPFGYAGGMHNCNHSNPTLINVSFINNFVRFEGGGIYNSRSNPTLINVTFSGNSADYRGGGISNRDGGLILTNTTFSGNSADEGGGIGSSGGDLRLINVTFSGNSAEEGGGIHNDKTTLVLTNCILWDNSDDSGTGQSAQIYNEGASSPGVNYSNVQGGVYTGTGNISANPRFLHDPDPGDGDWTTVEDNDYGDLRLRYDSPCIDQGTSSGASNVDFRGWPRPNGGGYDMGAYERNPIEVAKWVDLPLVHANQNLVYTIRLTNTGQITMTVGMTDLLPVDVYPNGTLTWIEDLAPGDYRVMGITVTVGNNYSGTLQNVVWATTEESLADVYTITSQAYFITAVAVSQVAAMEPAPAGEILTYTLHVTNTGSVTLTGTVTDRLPPGVVPAGVYTCPHTLGAPNGRWTREMPIIVPWSYSGPLTNVVRFDSAEGATDVHTLTTQVKPREPSTPTPTSQPPTPTPKSDQPPPTPDPAQTPVAPTDSDRDTIPDGVECPYVPCYDTDGNGFPDYLDSDADGDGIADFVEGTRDPDPDGVPNYRDLDSDDDGVPDYNESFGDTDSDGTPNFEDQDSDGDGTLDAAECPTGWPCPDSDGDGIPDWLDNNMNDGPFGDADGDGILNGFEDTDPVAPGHPVGDGDSDGIPNKVDTDSDGDGIHDIIEGRGDVDLDDIPNYLDPDSDGDGVLDGADDEPYLAEPPIRVYLPLVLRRWPPEAPTHVLLDAPDACPAGHIVTLGNFYRDDFDRPPGAAWYHHDHDWYTFGARAGETYVIATSNLESRSDTYLVLYGPDCSTEIAAHDDVQQGVDLSSRLNWTISEDGTYHVLISSWDWRVYGEDTGYSLSIAPAGVTSSANESPPPLDPGRLMKGTRE